MHVKLDVMNTAMVTTVYIWIMGGIKVIDMSYAL